MLKRTGALIIALAIARLAFAAGEEWQIVTDTRSVRDVARVGEWIWLATEGGLVEFSPSTGSFKAYTTLDGLGGLGVKKLLADGNGGIWAAFDNKMLQRWDPDLGVTHSVTALADQAALFSINDLTLNQRGLFLATNRGAALVTHVPRFDQWVWFEEYRRLGNFSPDLAANAVLVQGDYLWVGTEEGVARGNLNSPAPLDWRTFTTADGLQNNKITDLILFRDSLYAMTGQGLARFEEDRWRQLNHRRDFYSLIVHSDTLCAVASDGINWWTGNGWVRFGGFAIGFTDAEWDDTGALWAAAARDWRAPGGISRLTDTTWVSHIPPGPITNYVRATAFGSDGSVWFAGGANVGEYGLSRLVGSEWRRWCWPSFNGTAFSSEARSIAFDLDGGVWFGTFMGGVGRVVGDSAYTYNSDPATGARLRSYAAGGGVLAPTVVSDQAGNVWIANRGAMNGMVLACAPRSFIQRSDSAEPWAYFHQINFGQFNHYDLLTVDGRDRIWIASSANDQTLPGDQGVYVLDTRGTLADSTDDQIWGPIQGLPAREVLSIKYDSAGYVWIGSIRGAYYANSSGSDLTGVAFSQVYYMRDIPVRSIDIDPAGNKWFGSDFGISILAPDLFTVTRRITADPPDRLPVTSVQSVGIDPNSGWVYIGTRVGTAAMKTPYRDYGAEITTLTFEPNPFNPARGRLIFTGDALGGGGEVRIFTPDGRLVRALSHDAAALGWDGTDDSGRDVAEGIYLIVAYNSGGDAARSKVAVLRK